MAMRPRTGVHSGARLPRAGEREPGGTSVSSVATTPSETARRVLVRRAAGRAAWTSSPGVATGVTLVLAPFRWPSVLGGLREAPAARYRGLKARPGLVGRRSLLS